MRAYVYYCLFIIWLLASSVNGQDESNPALLLATRAGTMELSCPLGTTRRDFRQETFIDQACSVKMAGYLPRSVFWVYGLRLRLGPQKNLANIQPPYFSANPVVQGCDAPTSHCDTRLTSGRFWSSPNLLASVGKCAKLVCSEKIGRLTLWVQLTVSRNLCG